jgi:hypothetical protein
MSCSTDVPVANTQNALQSEASNFNYYSLAIDESTNISDTAQLAIFFYGESIKILISLKKWLTGSHL